MKKHLFFLIACLSLAILFATFSVLRGFACLQEVSVGLLMALAVSAFLWQKIGRRPTGSPDREGTGGTAVVWLLVPFVATAAVALIQSLHQKWDIGDTIGASFFVLFASLSLYEILRRRKKTDGGTRHN